MWVDFNLSNFRPKFDGITKSGGIFAPLDYTWEK
tara:strand:+ start:46 stop:147 length:102 start_codon:yes stop_codon:yes gene_type:complete